jgi:D-amino peptidase
MLHALVARTHGVVPVFLSGDAGICQRAMNFDPQIETVATFEGTGNATLSIHPMVAVDLIKAGVEKALKKKMSAFSMSIPEQFALEVTYKKHPDAFRASYYPGAKAVGAHTVRIEANNMLDIMRFIMFCV